MAKPLNVLNVEGKEIQIKSQKGKVYSNTIEDPSGFSGPGMYAPKWSVEKGAGTDGGDLFTLLSISKIPGSAAKDAASGHSPDATLREKCSNARTAVMLAVQHFSEKHTAEECLSISNKLYAKINELVKS